MFVELCVLNTFGISSLGDRGHFIETGGDGEMNSIHLYNDYISFKGPENSAVLECMLLLHVVQNIDEF